MNKSLAIVKARTVCHVHRFSSIGAWHVQCPAVLSEPWDTLSSHQCSSYKQAVQWCAQAVARVALHLVDSTITDPEFRSDVYNAMWEAQCDGRVSSSQEILREGLRYIQNRKDRAVL